MFSESIIILVAIFKHWKLISYRMTILDGFLKHEDISQEKTIKGLKIQ